MSQSGMLRSLLLVLICEPEKRSHRTDYLAGNFMSEERSAAEVRAGYIRAMGRELGELFHATSSELTWIHWRWKQYRTLFGEKQSRIDLLNKGKRQSQAVLTSFSCLCCAA